MTNINDFLKTSAGLRALLGSCNKACWDHIAVEQVVNQFITVARPTYAMIKVHPNLPKLPIFVYVPTIDDMWAVDPYDVANAVVNNHFWQSY